MKPCPCIECPTEGGLHGPPAWECRTEGRALMARPRGAYGTITAISFDAPVMPQVVEARTRA
jgi:hypothetical protein